MRIGDCMNLFSDSRNSTSGGSPESSLPSLILNPPRFSSSKNGRGCPLMKVTREIFLVQLEQPLYESTSSSPYGRIFHYEQPYLPISGPVHRVVESFGKSFNYRPYFFTGVHTIQLTSLSSLQTSLDILRTHKPPFMPRTGFVWPIMEPEATGSGSDQQTDKRKGTDEEANTTSASNSRKQQNHLLLFNAMMTTAAHASTTFTNNTRPAAEQPPATETAPPETNVERARSLSVAATPAPQSRRSSTPRVTGTSQSPDLGKGQPGVPPKKKKKRECIESGFGSSCA